MEETASLRTFTLNGVTLELPAPVQALLDKGWVFEDAQYDTATIEAGGSKSSVMLMNEYGKIVAVNFAGVSTTQSFNYGIKLKKVKRFIDEN